MRYRPRPLSLLACALAAALPSCVAPSAAVPTLASQRDALARVREAMARDYDLLGTQAAANLDARRRLLLGSAHRELIERGHVTAALEPDTGAFDADLSNPEVTTALIADVRLGRISRERAHDFLHDYALALRMVREGDPLREAMLARTEPVERAEAERALVMDSIANRRDAVALLLDDALRSNAALSDFAARSSLQDDRRLNEASPLWRRLLEVPARSDPEVP